MPRPIQRRENLANHPSLWLAATLEYGNIRNEQKLFNSAMELIGRPNKTANQEMVAEWTLRRLARVGRTWTIHPSSNRITANNSNSNSNPSAGFVYGSNSNSNMNLNNSTVTRASAARLSARRAAGRDRPAPPRESPAVQPSVRKYAERWRLKGAVKLVNLPVNKNNRTDPVSLHTFRSGQEAIQHQRRNAEGRIISTRYYLLPTIERLAGQNWKTIRRMHPNKVLVKGSGPGNKFLATKHVPNVITRLPMYRRNLTLVKFK